MSEQAAEDQPDFSDGIMICVRPNNPERFTVEGGTPADDVHVTLAYLGKVTDPEWDDAAREQISEVIGGDISERFEKVSGEVTAVTTFPLAGEDAPPLVLLIDAPGLSEMRSALVQAVDAALGSDQKIKSNHGFIPHLTLMYGASDEDVVAAEAMIGEKVNFDYIELVWGTEETTWDLVGAISDPSDAGRLPSDVVESAQIAEPGAQEGDVMPYEIVENHPECDEADGYAVIKAGDGELMGCHPSEADAKEQLAALHAAESEEEDSMEVSGDPLAIVIADEPSREERLSAIDEFVAAVDAAGGGESEAAEEGEDEGVMVPCPTCEGTGQVDGEECPTCGGTGEVLAEVEVEVEEPEHDMESEAPEEFQAIAVHHTETTDAEWDGPANEARAKSGESEDYYRNIFAWQDPEGDPEAKASWRFIHHEVNEDGTPGAANLRACSTGIGVLNGGRGGTTIPEADRQGVYEHLAAHLADAEKEVPELQAASEEEDFSADQEVVFKATPSHTTPTVDPPTFKDWDGNEAQKRARSGESPAYYGKIYAWGDPAEPDNKTSYKFPHHNVSESGEPGAAVVWAVHACIAVIDDSNIPTADYQGVYNHLAKHLRDAGMTTDEIPELGEDVASIDEVRAAIATVRTRYMSMVEQASREAANTVNITTADDTTLVGEMLRRWFDSVASRSGENDGSGAGAPTAEVEAEAFAAEDEPETAEPEIETEADPDVVGDFSKGDFDWEGVLIVEGMPSGDGRMIEEEALTWRNLPVPLMLQTVNAQGHDGAVIAGSIHEIERRGQEIIGRGYFDSGEAGTEAKRLLTEGTMRGVSADIDSVVAELRDSSGADVDEGDEDFFGEPEGLMEVLVEGRIMGATMTPFPAFQEAHLKVISKEEQAEDLVLVASGSEVFGEVWRVPSPYQLVGRGMEPIRIESLVASASVTELPVIPVNPPMEWFALAEMEEPHPVIIYPNGRIFGLVAKFGTCHIGFRDRCIDVPRTGDGYRCFRNKSLLTSEGELVATGPVYMDTVHPNLKLRASDAQAFYAHTGCAVADVALYENEFGIVAAGAVRSDASPEQIRALRGSDISPDWRNINGNLEVVGLLAVNVSGFIVEGLAASAGEAGVETLTPRARFNSVTDEIDSLVAAGSMRECFHCGQQSVNNETVMALLEMLNSQQRKIDDISEVIRPFRMERLASRVAEVAATNIFRKGGIIPTNATVEVETA